jgi:hypothetical protein
MANRALLEQSIAAVDEVLTKRAVAVGSGPIGDCKTKISQEVLKKGGGEIIQNFSSQVSSRADREASSKAVDEALAAMSKNLNSADIQKTQDIIKSLDDQGLALLRQRLPSNFSTKSDDELRQSVMLSSAIRDAVSDTESDIRRMKEDARRTTAAPRVESAPVSVY